MASPTRALQVKQTHHYTMARSLSILMPAEIAEMIIALSADMYLFGRWSISWNDLAQTLGFSVP